VKLFKKIDDYLLHYFPSIWVTRVHSFLPIGLGIVLLIYLGNMAIGWNPKGDRPESEWPVLMMVIPVLVYLVYWFIFQSRYNVTKSGGKLTILQEYLNFFLYACVFTVAYSIILVIPFSNDQKMTFAVSHDEVIQDIEYLNDGNSIVNREGAFVALDNDTYRVTESNYVGKSYYDDHYYEKDPYNSTDDVVVLTKRQVLERIDNYLASYNKYTYDVNTKSAEMVLSERINDETPYNYNYYDFYGGSWSVSGKVSKLRRLHEGTGFSFWDEVWFWRISFAFIGWLALFVWIFKQMNLRHFVFGFIAICLTPIVGGIVGGIIYGLFYSSYRSNDIEDVFLMLILLAYAIVALIFIRGYKQDKLNQTAYVMSMYFNFWMPILPLFLYLSMMSLNGYSYNHYYRKEIMGFDTEDVLYFFCVIAGLATIAIFKPVYAKFRSLPMWR
jgi:hypothetical protein